MVQKDTLHVVDKLLRDVMNEPNVPFGGKLFFACGDWRQIVRAVKHGSRAAIVGEAWGNVCPARIRRATFLLTIPTSAPDLPSHGEAPQVDHVALHTFPTKHVA